MSGSIFAEWGLNERVVGDTRELATALDCPTSEDEFTDGAILKRCLKAVPVEQLLQASVQIVGKSSRHTRIERMTN
jgi:hypothetical protein